ncbi:HtaA domain-containing protein [Leucobacter luti]|uniref:Htaa protein n=1 Tax=Leucobacter luti TaxID=340320 RepID=A0A4Q7TZ64_9MICO|nr:HtaA domain-containing protein [Leucobacter luti]MBL3698894.1 hypothetical protein [Leucobacter luti]RZT66273.1 Htaa protein [Leucobacter luti]
MNSTFPSRAAALIGTATLSVGLLAAPAAAVAAPVAATTTDASCSVSTATLNWGVKESFRSYISGSIANGEWTVSDDMRYETPDFIWNAASGEVASDLESGQIGFTGAVHFTGHDGAMKLDLADPIVEFEGEDTAYLTLTIGATDSADAGGEAAATTIRAAKIDLTGAVEAGGTELSIQGAVPRLTSEGAAALNGDYGSYVAGEELDPVVLNATVAGCELGASTAAPTETPQATASPETTPSTPEPAATPSIPWLPIGIGAVALLVIGVTGGMLLAGRKRTQPEAAPAVESPDGRSEPDA